jgi:hypothetical protein
MQTHYPVINFQKCRAGKWLTLMPVICCALGAMAGPVNDGADSTRRLALDLAVGGDHAGAATEFRRLALTAEDAAAQPGYYWAAANEYRLAGSFRQADLMLSRVEADDGAVQDAVRLLRGETESAQRRHGEAGFYFQSLARSPTASSDLRRWAARKWAAASVQTSDPANARDALAAAPDSVTPTVQAALATYEDGRDKNPRLGGLLGLLPGLGYIYAGEYANGVRSLLLNALFIFAMVDTARDEEWGFFAVASFFEITFYSGSIYGGIDASYRYNQARRDECAEAILDNVSVTADYQTLPVVSLQFTF